MPAYVIRIMLFMGIVTLLSCAYEINYSNNSIEVSGKIISISNQSKGRELTISFSDDNQVKKVLKVGVGPIIDFIAGYDVGDKLPIKYCRECYPIAKIGDTPNTYSLTLMMVLLSCVVFAVLIISWWKGKHT